MLQLLSPQLPMSTESSLSPQDAKILLEWVENYLMKPHVELGRKGAVCPFMEKSYFDGRVYVASYEASSNGFEKDLDDIFYETKKLQNIYLDKFKDPDDSDGVVMLVFPGWDCEYCDSIFNEILALLKDDFVSKKLMLGEFHSKPPQKSGLRNPNFKPLYSPMPMLVIRRMVPSDIAFLQHNPKWAKSHNSHFKKPSMVTRSVKRHNETTFSTT